MSAITDLVPSLSLSSFLEQRGAMVRRARDAARLLGEAGQIAASLAGDGPAASCYFRLGLRMELRHRQGDFVDGVDDYVKAIDASLWDRLFELSGIRTFMDAAARAAWSKNIERCEVPELTPENIEATFRALRDARGEMFERGVVAVFRSLSWDYKTNNPVMFGKRIVMKLMHVWNHGGATLDSERCDKLDDLLRVMCVLDGRPEADHRRAGYRTLSDNGWGGMVSRKLGPTTIGDPPLVSVRGFRNGNAHLTFLRPDLVDQMNAIIARHHPGALAPSREAA